MSFQFLAFVFGCLLLLIGGIGGGFEVKELKVPSVSTGNRVLSMVIGVIFVFLSYLTSQTNGSQPDRPAPLQQEAAMGQMEFDFDRTGSDVDHFLNPSNDPHDCEQACRKSAPCKAWTFVKPGIQEVQSVCWLKGSVPEPKRTPNCISGVKSGA